MRYLLGDVYTMDHEVVPRPCKIFNWLLNSSRDYFGLHQEKNVRVTMEFKVPESHIVRSTLSSDMVQRILRWERQKKCSSRKSQGPMAKKCCFNKIWMNFFRGEKTKTREDKRMVKLDYLFLKNSFCGHILKNNTFFFWCMVIPLRPHLVYT